MLLTETDLLKIAELEKLEIVEMDMRGRNKGFYLNGAIALRKNITSTTERKCILAEELGHHYTTVGNITDQSILHNRKQEKQARAWAYLKLVPLKKLVQAFEHGCRNRYELAEYLEVTEVFLQEAIDYYKEKYGISHATKEFTIYFEPFGILKMFEEHL